MWSPISVIVLSQLLNFVSAGGFQCGNKVFHEYEVIQAAKTACDLRQKALVCRQGLSKVSPNKVNGIFRSWKNYFKQKCPTITGTFPTSYTGDFFSPEEGPYISWHLDPLKDRIRYKKDSGLYRVIVRHTHEICEPVGAIIVRNGIPQSRCMDLKGEWIGAKGMADLDRSYPISSISRQNSKGVEFSQPESVDFTPSAPLYDRKS